MEAVNQSIERALSLRERGAAKREADRPKHLIKPGEGR
jgi:hypothetical protein